MSQAHFNGVSGLIAFSAQLNNVSQNISNMNTSGYKGKDSFLRYVESNDGRGLGVSYGGLTVRVKNGESKQTGNQTDLFINGKGYFILQNDNNELFYSRAGQFKFNEKGKLVDQLGMLNVMGWDGNSFTEINIDNYLSLPPTSTRQLDLNGILSSADTTAYTISNVGVYDSTGSVRNIKVSFEKQTESTNLGTVWSFKITDDKNKILSTGTINFTAAGTAQETQKDVELNFQEGIQNIKIDLSGINVVSVGTSSLQAIVNDGGARAGISTYNFDENGTLEITYNNNQKKKTDQTIALANFSDESLLIQDQNAFLRKPISVKVEISKPNIGYFGKIQGGYVELANIDLSQEFGNILIIQRGYQASSRVMNVANEMLEQLYNSSRGG